jgi:hypothetical protein
MGGHFLVRVIAGSIDVTDASGLVFFDGRTTAGANALTNGWLFTGQLMESLRVTCYSPFMEEFLLQHCSHFLQ